MPVGPGLTPEEVEEWQQVGRLARQWGLKTVDLAVRVVPDEVRALVPRELAESYGLVPFSRFGEQLRVAVSDPLDVERIDSLHHLLGLDIEVYLAPATQIERAIDRCFARPDGLAKSPSHTRNLTQAEDLHPGPASADGDAPALEASAIFPHLVTSMFGVGEETGALSDMLGRIADIYDDEVDQAVVALTAIIEPVMIVFMALVVGLIVLALLLPMVGIMQHLQ